MDPTCVTASQLLDEMNSGAITAEEVARAYLDRIARFEGRVRAFLHQEPEPVLAHARAIDARRRRGEPLGRLAGVPVAIKDNLCTIGVPTTCGSRMLAELPPPL